MIVPSAISAANPTVSDSVGCGWMVSPMSSASAPTSIASTASAISSPALTPTMPRAEHAARPGLDEQLGQPVGAAHARARGRTPPTGTRLLELDARPPWPRVSVRPDPGDLGIGVGDATGSSARRSATFVAGDHLGGDLALVRRLVGEHRLAAHVADREDVRHVGAHLRVDAR